jgi:hypothetical protein
MDPQRILIFASEKALIDLKNSENWAGDGTFKCCSSIYYQLYTLHIQYKNLNIPRLFALLPDKSQETYQKLFSQLKVLLLDKQPTTMMMDFEKAEINSFSSVFDTTHITCCLFHLAQNVYRQIVNIGLKEKYHRNDEFALQIRCFPALSLLPVDDVITGFVALVIAYDLPSEFTSYFEKYYIGELRGRGLQKRQKEPSFPISIWNVYDRMLMDMPRTNNGCEGFHNAIKSSITNVHPNLWTLIGALKKEECLSQTKIIHYLRGDKPTKNVKYQEVVNRIKNVFESTCGQ